MKLTSILGNVILYSCGGHEKDGARKVILISSCVVKNLDSVMKEALMVRQISLFYSILL